MLTGAQRGLELRRVGVEGTAVTGRRALAAQSEVEVRHAVTAHALFPLQQLGERSRLPLLLLLYLLLKLRDRWGTRQQMPAIAISRLCLAAVDVN